VLHVSWLFSPTFPNPRESCSHQLSTTSVIIPPIQMLLLLSKQPQEEHKEEGSEEGNYDGICYIGSMGLSPAQTGLVSLAAGCKSCCQRPLLGYMRGQYRISYVSVNMYVHRRMLSHMIGVYTCTHMLICLQAAISSHIYTVHNLSLCKELGRGRGV
jgi:hypothetical protein